MNSIMKDHRQEVFRTMATDSPPPPQLLNRQKTTNSFKNLANVEQIEVEQLATQGANEIYQFTSSNKNTSIKKQLMDSYREQLSDFSEETAKSKAISFMDKPQPKTISTSTKQLDTSSSSKPKQLNNLNANYNSTNKLTKQKTEMVSSQANIIRNLQSDSLITTKLSVDKQDKEKNKKKKDKKSKSKKDKETSKKQHSSAVNIHSMENNLMNDMFRVNEQNTTKLNIKMNRQETSSNFKPIIKKSYSNLNQGKSDKPPTPEKENPETIRWKFELDDPIEEKKRVEIYKQSRRSRYIDQRNKQLKLHNGSTTSFLPYLYYETPAPKPEEEEESIDEAINVESKENILETTLTRSLHRLSSANLSSRFEYEAKASNDKNSDHNISSTLIDTNTDGKQGACFSSDDTKLKEKCSNVTTDSAISSLSSSSR